MNVLVFASRKGGSGKSTLAAHLASYIANPSRKTLLIDNDPQGSLSLWHKIRDQEYLGLKHNVRNLGDALRDAGDCMELRFGTRGDRRGDERVCRGQHG